MIMQIKAKGNNNILFYRSEKVNDKELEDSKRLLEIQYEKVFVQTMKGIIKPPK